MKDLEEQRVCVKFCFKLGNTFTETFQMLQQAYGEDTGPSHHPAKHVPGRVPELEKNVGSGVSKVEGSTLKETSLIKL
jgi:hypothetical protein